MPDELYEEIDRIFHPRSMAAVGVSDTIENQGMSFLAGYGKLGFKGPLYAIHPTKTMKKFDTRPSVLDVPGPLDHVKIAVPAASVPRVMRDCVKKGVRVVTIFSSGFSESGTAEGAALEEEVLAIAREGGARVIGPNCMGLYCPETGLNIRVDQPAVEDGRIGIVAQSGGVTISFVMKAAEKGIGVSKGVSYGNESDLGPAEFLHYLARDPKTEVICLYIEGARRPAKLRAAMEDTAARKPLIVLKGGMTDVGHRAVASHTGAMTGSASVWRALARQCGAALVNDLDEMLDLAVLMKNTGPPPGKKVGLLTVSGGFGVFATDQVVEAGFEMPGFSEDTVEALKRFVDAPGTSLKNPADMAAKFFQPQNYSKIFDIFGEDRNVDCYIMILGIEYLTYLGKHQEQWSGFMVKALASALKRVEKPVYLVFFHTVAEELRETHVKYLLAEGFSVFPNMTRCLMAMNRSLSIG